MCQFCTPEARKHQTVNVRGIPIDERLAPLINTLWSIGIRTTDSCQEVQREPIPVTEISFETTDDATKFITLLAAANPQYKEELQYLDDFPTESGFRVYIWYQGSIGNAFAQLFPTVTVEMPAKDLEEITRNINQHLAWVALSAVASE